jgi:hypothetical protein
MQIERRNTVREDVDYAMYLKEALPFFYIRCIQKAGSLASNICIYMRIGLGVVFRIFHLLHLFLNVLNLLDFHFGDHETATTCSFIVWNT